MVDFAFLDSGTGGIPYMMHLLQKVPNASCVYIADTKHFPYGEKSHTQIVDFVIELTRSIIEKFCPKVIILACNTMSVNALDVLRKTFPNNNFIGTVPAIKVAATLSKKRKIGLLATNSTINNPYNLELKKQFANDCILVLRGDSQLISFIEHKSFDSSIEEIKKACVPAVDFFKQNDCDVIILGCTHFLNIKKEIQEVCGKDILVVDSVEGVINHAMDVCNTIDNNSLVGVLGDSLGEGVAKDCNAGWRQGKTFPLLFVTGFSDKKCENEYNTICSRYRLNFGGII